MRKEAAETAGENAGEGGRVMGVAGDGLVKRAVRLSITLFSQSGVSFSHHLVTPNFQ